MSETNDIKILADREDIVAIANAVRSKTGTTSEMTLNGIVSGIQGIKVETDPVLQDKTVTPTTSAQTITADSGYDGLDTVTVNAMPTATQATPSITVNSSGLITATATQSAGYVSAGTKSATKQLTTQAAKTITPSTSSQTAVASGRYTTGAVTVAGDSNLKAENIKSGVSIFGVTGTHSGGVVLPTLTSPATASELFANKELIDSNGNKVTGTFTIDSELTTQDDLITQIQTALQNKASSSGSEPVLQSKTVTPGAEEQIIIPDNEYDGLLSVVVNGDANLVSENIAYGVSIFGVTGTHGAGGSNTAETVGFSFLVQSSATGSVIYSFSSDAGIEVSQVSLSYFATTKKYRTFMDTATLLNTPIVILSSGTINCAAPSGCTASLIASGSGYAIYSIASTGSSSGGSEGPEGPGGPGSLG